MPEVLRGQLSAIRLPTLLQALEGELFTGVLVLDGAGSVSFGRGRVVAAEAEGLHGVDGLLELFLATTGTFFAVDDPPPAAAGAPLGDAMALLMEGCRISDEWERHRTSVFTPAGVAPRGLEPVWTLFDGRRSFERVVRGHGRGRAPFLAPIESALADGALRLVGQAEQPVASDFDDALRRGREALKAQSPSEAVDWFLEAVRMRPDDRTAHQNLRHARQLAEGGRRPGIR